MATWETYLDQHASHHLEELFDLLRIPSVSALPEHKGLINKQPLRVSRQA